ncbi:MAG: hypothetical protein AAF851_07575 [Myxococcota bacterium]
MGVSEGAVRRDFAALAVFEAVCGASLQRAGTGYLLGVRVICPACGATVPSEQLNVARAIAVCSACEEVFGFAEQVPGSAHLPDATRAPVDMPANITANHLNGETVLTWRWFDARFFLLLFFCAFWNGFLVLWYSIAFSQEDPPLLMLLIPVIHIAVGLGVGWYTLCGFLNRTTITAGWGKLKIRHGPLPWPGNVELDGRSVDQLWVTEQLRRSRTTHRRFFRLHLRTGRGEERRLLDFENERQALYVEQQIERALGIKDRRVAGEVPVRSQ